MSNFRYLSNKTDKTSKELTKEVFEKILDSEHVKGLCLQAREAHDHNDKDRYDMLKGNLPLGMWQGYNKSGNRDKSKQKPTQYFMIDIDHAKVDTETIWRNFIEQALKESGREEWDAEVIKNTGVRIVRQTPSGGTRFVVLATKAFSSVQEHQAWFFEHYNLSQYGDYDEKVYDFSRTDFLVCREWVKYYDPSLFSEDPDFKPITRDGKAAKDVVKVGEQSSKIPEITAEMKDVKLEGKLVREIAEEWVNYLGGVPEEGQRHAFYNELIKNFRNLCDSDPRVVFAVLPLCDGVPEKRYSQCESICKSNNTSLIPKDFYFWLVKNGYKSPKTAAPLREYLESDETEREPLPKLPPVFREFCSICPPDFIYPTIVGLLPVLGTLTSYVRADYIDYTEQSTTFFTCIWAPPGCGKSFAKRLVDVLMKKIRVRDEINNIREQLYLIDTRTKSDNEKGVDIPHVMVRIMPAINSLPEFLEKMRDNHGFHMFTLAEEVDTFKKGSSSGGADKSDLFRTAWDNGEYGQSFKSASTFKGMVKVYYNILLTGTPGAVKKYYSNVEDGMVTRISICEIENQQFAKFQAWKQFTKKQMEVVNAFINRCDTNTYKDPCEIDEAEALVYSNNTKNYDENVKWKFSLRDKQKVDMSWLYPTILDWLEEKRIEASRDYNQAADTFRRRTAVKGFRLGMICICCWAQVKEKEKATIKNFVRWFMDRDLAESLKMFGEKYNNLQNAVVDSATHHKSLFNSLGNEFTRVELINQCIKQNIHSKVKLIIHRWKVDKVIEVIDKEHFKKAKKL